MDCSSGLSPEVSRNKSRPRPLCLICIAHPFSSERYYCVFIFDPIQKLVGKTDGKFFIKHPTLRIYPKVGVTQYAFHVSGSTLFIFGSGDEYKGKSVYSLDLSGPCENLSVHLESHMASIDLKERDFLKESMVEADNIRLKRENDMTGWKSDVLVASTPNGRYLMVFSTKLWNNTHTYFWDENRCDFELYDLFNKSWTALPDLERERIFSRRKGLQHIAGWQRIDGYGFVSDHLFVISTPCGKFSLDIHQKCWESYIDSEEILIDHIDSGCEEILPDDEFYFTDSHIVRRVDQVRLAKLPPLMPMPPLIAPRLQTFVPEIRCVGTMIDIVRDQFSFCLARAAVEQTDFKAYLTFDLFLTNLTKYRRKQMQQKKMKKVDEEKMKNEKKEQEKAKGQEENMKDEKKVEELEKEKCQEGEKKKKKKKKKKDITTTKLNSFGIMLAKQEDTLTWFEATEVFEFLDPELIETFDKMDISG